MVATAPYNFIRFVPPVTAGQLNGPGFQLPPHDVPLAGFHTGYVDYTLTTLSPLHIGPGTESLTTPDGSYFWIPGSAVRGMIRTILEYVLGSDLDEPVLKAHLSAPVYYRAPIVERDASTNRRAYRDAYWTARGTSMNEQRVGLIRRDADGGLWITEGQRFKVRRDLVAPLSRGYPGASPTRLDAHSAKALQFREVWFVADRAGKAIRVDAAEFPGAQKGWLLVTGVFDNTTRQRHAFIVTESSSAVHLGVDPSVIAVHKESRTAHSGELMPDLEEYLRKHPDSPIPVFFDASGSKVLRIGTAGGFRVKAMRNRATLVPRREGSGSGNLLAIDALLGRVTASDEDPDPLPTIAGRVSFGHALSPYAAGGLLSAQRVRLESPKLTATHLRLKDGNRPDALATFDSPNAEYRGRTIYLHRWNSDASDELNWQAAVSEHKTGAPPNSAAVDAPEFQPVKTGTSFGGRIHFRNLTDAEFGALVFALRLWNEPGGGFTHAHKIGGLRPLGLGSVGIRFTVFRIDARERYSRSGGLGSLDSNAVVSAMNRFLRLVAADQPDRQWALGELQRASRWERRLPRTQTEPMSVARHAQRELLPTIVNLFPK